MDQPTNDQLIEQLAAGTGTFAAKMAEISTAAIKSDHEGQMLHLSYVQGVLAMPNIVMDQSEDIGFGLGTVARHDERAAITAVKVDRLGYETVDMDFSMTIGSHTEALKDTEVNAGSKTEASASGGMLWAKASVKQTISADVRHQDKQTRSTDMSASVDISAKLTRQDAPEGLMSMIDTANEFSRKMNEIRLTIAAAKADKIVQQIADGEIDPVSLSEKQADEIGSEAPAPA